MGESFLSEAGSLFFAAWILVVAAVSLVAFRRDLFPSKVQIDPSQHGKGTSSTRR